MQQNDFQKTISILVPCFNEQENVVPMSKALVEVFAKSLPQYDYEIVFIDNCSTDNTRPLLREICAHNPKIKAIFNARNFGQFNSPYYGMLQTSGDCTITVCCDFQDPIELIPVFVEKWEEGAKIVSGIKTSSDENHFVRFLRTCYYKLIRKLSQVEQIEHFTGFGLYDRSFVDVLRNLHDPTPFIRGIVAELGYKRVDVPYRQAKRKAGKTHNNFKTLYDAAMLSFTTYTKFVPRLATLLGAFGVVGCVVAEVVVSILFWGIHIQLPYKLISLCLLFGAMCCMQWFFIGFLGEYVMNINTRMLNRPLVIEEKRINFLGDENARSRQ